VTHRPPESAATEISRRFVTAEQEVPVGDRVVTLVKPRNPDDLITEADYVRDERLPYWADLWPSSIALAGHLVHERGNGRTLLELGCGLGLVTVAAMIAGYDVLATDYYDDALLFAAENARRAVGRAPAVRMVNWRDLPDDLGTFERIVAADVLYENEYGPLVAEVVAMALAPHGRATIADPGRTAAPEFAKRCAELGLAVDSRHEIPFEDGPINQRIRLYQVRWRAAMG
jgi:predicted nicotinamide N-methyase